MSGKDHHDGYSGKPSYGPPSMQYLDGQRQRWLDDRAKEFKPPVYDFPARERSAQYEEAPPARPRPPTARQLRRRRNPPPEYAGLRRTSNVISSVVFVGTAGFALYEGVVRGDPIAELIFLPLFIGLVFAVIGMAPLMMLRWGLRLAWSGKKSSRPEPTQSDSVGIRTRFDD